MKKRPRNLVFTPWTLRAFRALALLAVCAAMLFRVVQPGVIPYAHDTLTHDYPLNLWAWSLVRETGAMPLWNPHLQNGLPTIGSLAWCPFYPTAWLMALSPEGGFRLQWLMARVVAGVGMAAWGRAAGFSVAARWTAAVAFALSGHLVTLISPGHLQKAQALAWLPWALAAVEWGLRQSGQPFGRGRGHLPAAAIGGLAAGAALAMQGLAGHLQIAWITAVLVGFRAVWIFALRILRRESPGRALGRMALFAAVMAVAAGLLSGAQILPALETARLSNRAAGVAYDEAVLTSYPPRELFEYVFPRFLGDSVRGGWNSYQGEWGERLVTDYAGAGAILLALIGVFAARRRMELRLWLAAIAIGATLIALGRWTPVYRWAYHWLPGFNRFRSPGTQMAATAFALAALAGVGMDSLRGLTALRGLPARRWFGGLAGMTAVMLVGGGLLLARARGFLAGPESALSAGSAAERFRLMGVLFDSIGGTLVWGGVFSAALAGALGILAAARRRITAPLTDPSAPGQHERRRFGLPASALLAIPIGILAFDLIVRLQPFISPEPLAPYYRYLFQSPGDDRIASDPVLPRRIYEHGNELTIRPLMRGIDVPLGYHPVSYRWMHETMQALGLESSALRSIWAVRYVRTPGDTPPADDPTTWTALMRTPGWTLWRDEQPPPFARFPSGIAEGPAATLLPPLNALPMPLDPRRPAIVEAPDAQSLAQWQARADSQFSPPKNSEANPSARVETLEAGKITLRVHCPEPSWMVLSMPPAPGWEIRASGMSGASSSHGANRASGLNGAHSTNDEREKIKQGVAGDSLLPCWRADGCALLLPWPGNAHAKFLQIDYRPWSARMGLFLSLAGLFLAAALGGLALRVEELTPGAQKS